MNLHRLLWMLILCGQSSNGLADVLYTKREIRQPFGLVINESWIDSEDTLPTQLVIRGDNYGIPLFSGLRLIGIDKRTVVDSEGRHVVSLSSPDTHYTFYYKKINWMILFTYAGREKGVNNEMLIDVYLYRR